MGWGDRPLGAFSGRRFSPFVAGPLVFYYRRFARNSTRSVSLPTSGICCHRRRRRRRSYGFRRLPTTSTPISRFSGCYNYSTPCCWSVFRVATAHVSSISRKRSRRPSGTPPSSASTASEALGIYMLSSVAPYRSRSLPGCWSVPARPCYHAERHFVGPRRPNRKSVEIKAHVSLKALVHHIFEGIGTIPL